MRLGQFFPSSVAVGLLASVWVIYARNLYIAQGSIIRVFCVNLCGFGGGSEDVIVRWKKRMELRV